MPKVKTNFKSSGQGHFIREWRKSRHLTLEQLAERVGVTHGALSQLERGLTKYSQGMLEALARELNCEPGDLIMRDPSQPGAIWSIWDNASEADRIQIEAIASAVVSAKKRA